MLRYPLLLLLIALVSCGNPPVEVIAVPVEGPHADLYAGDWYAVNGLNEFSIGLNSSGQLTAIFRQPWGDGYRPTRVQTNPDSLLVSIQTPDGEIQVEMQMVRERVLLAHGSRATLMTHNYWLYHEPSRFWLIRATIERRLTTATEAAEPLLDRLVRTL